MKPPEQVRDEAAEKYCKSNDRFGNELVYSHPAHTFQSGYDYAVRNDPRVLALVEALDNVCNTFNKNLDLIPLHHLSKMEGMRGALEMGGEALRAWEGTDDKG